MGDGQHKGSAADSTGSGYSLQGKPRGDAICRPRKLRRHPGVSDQRGRELLGRFAGSLLIPMRVVVVKT
jgi:hypothetical protein